MVTLPSYWFRISLLLVRFISLGVKCTLRHRHVAHVLHVLHPNSNSIIIFQILIFNRNIRKCFFPSFLIRIMHVTYRWKALERLDLMVPQLQRNKKMAMSFRPNYSHGFHILILQKSQNFEVNSRHAFPEHIMAYICIHTSHKKRNITRVWVLGH